VPWWCAECCLSSPAVAVVALWPQRRVMERLRAQTGPQLLSLSLSLSLSLLLALAPPHTHSGTAALSLSLSLSPSRCLSFAPLLCPSLPLSFFLPLSHRFTFTVSLYIYTSLSMVL